MSEKRLPYQRDFWPHTVLIEEDAAEDELSKRIVSRLPEAKVKIIRSDEGDPLVGESLWSSAETGSSEAERFSFGKRVLLLKRFRGSWLKACPGTSGHVCCNLWTINPGEGCPLDCTYCYLQSYLRRNPTLKLYTNVAEMLGTIGERAAAEPQRLFRVGTGEVIDSLVWDDLSDLTLALVPFFAKIPNLMLELKTKHDYVDNLMALRDVHNGKTVVAWSVNAKSVSERDEAFTAPLSARIAAAARVAACGYKVAFHFDPLIYFEGWEDEYRDTVRQIFAIIPVEKIAWISISSLRYQPEMQTMMLSRFSGSRLPFGEQFLASDNKLRYVQPIRFRMLNFMWRELKRISSSMPIYMCMESSHAWRTVAGGPPVAGSELVEVFSRKGRLNILPSDSSEATETP